MQNFCDSPIGIEKSLKIAAASTNGPCDKTRPLNYNCPLCHDHFEALDDGLMIHFMFHINDIHNEKATCANCGEEFISIKDYVKHLSEAHPVPSLETNSLGIVTNFKFTNLLLGLLFPVENSSHCLEGNFFQSLKVPFLSQSPSHFMFQAFPRL